MISARFQDCPLNFPAHCIGMIARGSGAIRQTRHPSFFIALQPFVPGLPTHPKLAAQLSKIPFILSLPTMNELHSFFHCTCLFPAHKSVRRIAGLQKCYLCAWIKVLPICPVHTGLLADEGVRPTKKGQSPGAASQP